MKIEPMSYQAFWSIIDSSASHEATPQMLLDHHAERLSLLSPDELVAYEMALDEELRRAYSWNLIGVADILNRGVTDDGFLYFRLWLISKGNKVFETAIQSPDDIVSAALSPGPGGYYELEGLLFTAKEVWSRKTGQDTDSFPFYAGMDDFSAPEGQPLGDDEDVKKRFPKLWKRFRN